MINESVTDVVEDEGWGEIILTEADLLSLDDVEQVDEVRRGPKDRIKLEVRRMLRSGNFAIMSPHRGFSFTDEEGDLRHHDDVQAARRAGADVSSFSTGQQQRPRVKRRANRAMWWDLRNRLRRMGFHPILATGLYQETGMERPSPEASVMFGPTRTRRGQEVDFDLPLVKRLASRYNQDSFIYSGPETSKEVWLYSTDDQRQGYTKDFPLGKAQQVSMREIKRKLDRAGEEQDEAFGATQPITPRDNPDAPRFGTKIGKGATGIEFDPE